MDVKVTVLAEGVNMSKNKCIIDEYNTIYEYPIYVVVNPDKKIVNSRFGYKPTEKNEDGSLINDENSRYLAFTSIGAYDKIKDRKVFVVVFNRVSEDIFENINTCAHEANHVVNETLDIVNVPLNEDTQEAYAYL